MKINFLMLALSLILLASCKKQISSNSVSVCKEFSVNCELQKQFAVIKIIKLYENRYSVDVLGNPLIIGNWYVRVNSTRVLFPIRPRNADNILTVGTNELNGLSFPLSSENSKKVKAEKIIVGMTPTAQYVSVDAEVLLTGENELRINSQIYQELILKRN